MVGVEVHLQLMDFLCHSFIHCTTVLRCVLSGLDGHLSTRMGASMVTDDVRGGCLSPKQNIAYAHLQVAKETDTWSFC